MKAALITIGLALGVVFVMFIYSCLIIAARDVDDFELYDKEVDSDGIDTKGES